MSGPSFVIVEIRRVDIFDDFHYILWGLCNPCQRGEAVRTELPASYPSHHTVQIGGAVNVGLRAPYMLYCIVL